MGGGSPTKVDLVCPSCDYEFLRIVSSNIPSEFECPDCGAAVPAPEEIDEESEASFSGDPAPTARVDALSTSDESQGDALSNQGKTVKDQESLEKARERSQELETFDEATSDDSGSARDPSEDDGTSGADPELGASLDPGEESGGDFADPDMHERETRAKPTPLVEEEGEDEPEDEELEKTPALGMDEVAERMSKSEASAGAESTEAVAVDEEKIDEEGPPTAPDPHDAVEAEPEELAADREAIAGDEEARSEPKEGDARQRSGSGVEQAFEDSVPPELEEEAEAAVDEALREEFDEEDEEPSASSIPAPGGYSEESETGSEAGDGSGMPARELAEEISSPEGAESEADEEPAVSGFEAARKEDRDSEPPDVPSGEQEDEALPETVPPEALPEDARSPVVEVDEDVQTREESASDSAEQPAGVEGLDSSAPGPANREPSSDDRILPESNTGEDLELEESEAFEGATDAGESTPGDGRSTIAAVAVILAVVALALGGVIWFNPAGILPVGGSAESGAEGGGSTASPQKVEAAVAAAQESLQSATSIETGEPTLQARVAERLREEKRFGDAAEIFGVLWRDEKSTAKFGEQYIETLIRAERYTSARRVATEAIQITGERERFRKHFYRAVEQDERLQNWEPVEISELEKVEKIHPVRDADVRGFALAALDGSTKYLFQPETHRAGEWRDDVAAWRLCELIVCSFEIPRTRPARISRSRFEEMYDSDQSSVDSAVSEFRWREAEGDGDAEKTFVHGSIRAWRGDVVRWPLEQKEVWRSWLSAYEDPSVLERPLRESLKPFREVGDGSLYEAVLTESEGIETRRVARQLSDILVFDFLTNNWGRFADEPSAFGSRNHFADGSFVTIRTDTVFQRRKSTRVEGRFGWVSRFGRDRMTALRLLERERIEPLLYPDPSPYDENKLEIFWDQRRAVLDRVDELVDELGRESVLTFE